MCVCACVCTCFCPQETERLEQEQASLQQQVDSLRDERARLEHVLTTHSSACSLSPAMYPTEMPLSATAPLEVKQEPEEVQDEALYPLKQEALLDAEDQYAHKDAFGTQTGAGFSFSYRFIDCNSSETDSSLSYSDELLNSSIPKVHSTDNSRGSHYSDVRVLSSPTL